MRKIGYFISILVILYGCEKAYVQPKEIPETVSFSIDIIPIFSGNCVSCHVSGGLFPGLILSPDVAYNQLLTDGMNAPYINLTDAESSTLVVKMKANMPPAGLLPSDKIDIIVKWINEGAENN